MQRFPRVSLAAKLLGSTIALAAAVGVFAAAPATEPGAAALELRIDSIFAHFGPTTPGCAVGVFRAGEVVFARGYGMANLEHSIPISPGSVFDIASNTKQFTAFAIHLLARREKLSLDDDVRHYVPELADFGAVTTLRHMMQNTSGLRDDWSLMTLADARWTNEHPVTRRDFMDLLSRQRALSFPSGERYIYSTTNWGLLAMVVERVDGRPFRDFMEQEVFEPLGMTSTLVRDDPTRVVPGRPTGYRALPEGGYRIYTAWALAAGLAGSVGIYSTLGDLARWDANFFDEHLGGAGMTEAMYTQARLTSGDTIAYASGLFVWEHRGLRTVWHGGLGTGSSEILRFPEQRLSVAVLCNSNVDSYGLATSVAELYLEVQMNAASEAAAGFGSHRVMLEKSELERFAGTYAILENGQVVEYVIADGALATPEDNGVWPMVALGAGRFEDEWVRIHFAPDAREGVMIDKMTSGQFSLRRIDPAGRLWTPTPVDLAAYAGAYQSDELDLTWTLHAAADRFLLRRKGAPDLVLQPVVPDRFRSSWFMLSFQRGPDGDVSGLSVDTERARNMEFTRKADR